MNVYLRVAAVALLVALGFLAVVHNREDALIGTVGFSIIYFGYCAFMLLAYRHSNAIRNLLAYRIVATIGVYSYGIYLWHLSVRDVSVHLAAHIAPSLQWPFAILCQYSAALLLGAGLTRLIEWPSLRLRDKFFPAKDRHSPIEARRWNPDGAVGEAVSSEMATS